MLGWEGTGELRWGAVLIAGACLCWAIDNCVTAALDELAAAHITLAKGMIAGGANLAIGIGLDGVPPVGATFAALGIGAFGYGISITVWVAGARELGAARGQLVFAAAPFVGAAVAWTVLDEPMSSAQLVSVLIALGGVALVAGSSHLHEHTHAAVEHHHEHIHDDGHHQHAHGDCPRRHQHTHRHLALAHAHSHVPDIHHRHDHYS